MIYFFFVEMNLQTNTISTLLMLDIQHAAYVIKYHSKWGINVCKGIIHYFYYCIAIFSYETLSLVTDFIKTVWIQIEHLHSIPVLK